MKETKKKEKERKFYFVWLRNEQRAVYIGIAVRGLRWLPPLSSRAFIQLQLVEFLFDELQVVLQNVDPIEE